MSEKVYCSGCKHLGKFIECNHPTAVYYTDDFYARTKTRAYMVNRKKDNDCKDYEKYVPFFIKLFKWGKWWKV